MNYLLLHGAWHGGWCWKHVAKALRLQGHDVYTPTFTGCGERAHLLNKEVGLTTFIEDVLAVIENEELNEINLVGHSFAGPVISAVADRIPEKIRHLLFLDALIVTSGESAMSILPTEVQRERSRTVDKEGLRMAIPSAEKMGVFENNQVDWLSRRLTPHPLNAYKERLNLQHPIGNGIRKTYIAVTNPWYAPLEKTRKWVREQKDWEFEELAAGHDAMITSPKELTTLLLKLTTNT
jgi:pimeloyl-ACP methyl ester carboxylesterase